MSFLFLLCCTVTAEEPREVTNSVAMQFVRIPAGEFLHGSRAEDDAADPDELPQHRVHITKAFYLGKFEVTQGQFELMMNENPSWFSPYGGGRDVVIGQDAGRLPVEMVSWDEADRFCLRLNELPFERAGGRMYRLPTEAEWEYACRAGSTTRYTWGDDLSASQANILDSAAPDRSTPRTRPGGSYIANAWGLHDMHGNVWEWCADHYAADAYRTAGINPAARSADGVIVDPPGPKEGTGRVVRGGDYRFDSRQARSANRDFTRQSRRDLGNGFRVVLVFVEP